MKVLCGDIGGTNTRLALFEVNETTLNTLEEGCFESQNFSSLEDIVGQFLDEKKLYCEWACFGVAGPVKDRLFARQFPPPCFDVIAFRHLCDTWGPNDGRLTTTAVRLLSPSPKSGNEVLQMEKSRAR